MKAELILKIELENGKVIEVNTTTNKYTYNNQEHELDLQMIKIITPIYSEYMNRRLILKDLRPYKESFFDQEITISKFETLENEGKIQNWIKDRYPKCRTYQKAYLCKLTEELRDYLVYYNEQVPDFINGSDCIEVMVNKNCNVTLNYFNESESVASDWYIEFEDEEDFNRFCGLLECIDN